MARYALIDKDGTVLNVIEWDGASDYEIPLEISAIPAPDGIGPGDRKGPQGWEPAAPVEEAT